MAAPPPPSMDELAMLHGQVDIVKRTFSFADSMALKCAVELRIADIIHSHGGRLSLSQIAANIDSPSPNIDYLERIMRMLVRVKLFTTYDTDGDHILYGLTPSSMAILHDAEMSLAPFILMQTHPLLLSPWHYLSDCVKNGGSGFKKANGFELFEMASNNQELNKIFNDALQCSAKIFAKAIVLKYGGDGLSGVGSLVDVGGGLGYLMAEIVKAFPHVKGVNFDLPHVVATAPEYDGVKHVAGDMFDGGIPNADAIIMKQVLHDWGDEDCVKILKNCRKAIPEKTGKVVIVDLVLKADADANAEVEGLFGNLDAAWDLAMMAHSLGGKERTELEWKKILQEGGFPRYKIIELPVLASIIEAYPE